MASEHMTKDNIFFLYLQNHYLFTWLNFDQIK